MCKEALNMNMCFIQALEVLLGVSRVFHAASRAFPVILEYWMDPKKTASYSPEVIMSNK